MKPRTVQVQDLAKATLQFLPDFGGSEERRVAVGLYRLLAGGDPISPDRLADHVGLPAHRIRSTLKSWNEVLYDDEDHITGFRGLSLSQRVNAISR